MLILASCIIFRLKIVTKSVIIFTMKAKTIIRSLLIVGIIFGGYLAFCKAKEGFHLGNILTDFHYHPEWEIPLSPQQESHIKEILNQPFYYIGKGGQAYAFETKDQKYVIKFLRTRMDKQKLWNYILSYVPFVEDRRINEWQRRTKKIYEFFRGYKLIYEQNKGGGALEYLHFNPTFNQFGTVLLYDKIGMKHYLDLDQVAFIIQHKGRTFGAQLKSSLDKGDLPGANFAIQQVFDFLHDHYQKGLYDRDYGVIHNMGFINDQPIFIDLGKMSYLESMKQEENYKKEAEIVSRRIKQWVKKEYPSYTNKIALP